MNFHIARHHPVGAWSRCHTTRTKGQGKIAMSSLQHGLDAADHFARLSTWLEMEGEAEKARLAERRRRRSASAAERTGETLLDLVVRSHTTGLGGRYLLTLDQLSKETGCGNAANSACARAKDWIQRAANLPAQAR